MHEKRGDLNRDRRVGQLGGCLDRVAKTLWGPKPDFPDLIGCQEHS